MISLNEEEWNKFQEYLKNPPKPSPKFIERMRLADKKLNSTVLKQSSTLVEEEQEKV